MKVYLVLAAGLVLFVGGFVALGTNDVGSDVGWFAYAPEDDGRLEFSNGAQLFTRADQLCLAAVGVGVAMASGCTGFLLGRRRSA